MLKISPLQRLRAQYTPKIPSALHSAWQLAIEANADKREEDEMIAQMFPHTFGKERSRSQKEMREETNRTNQSEWV